MHDDYDVILEGLRGHKYEILYEVTLFTGLRQGEVLGLSWDDIDFDRKIHVRKQLQKTEKVRGEYVLVSTKNNRDRLLNVADSVMALLLRQRETQDEMKTLAGERWNNPWDLVFTNESGGHLCHFTVYRNFKNSVKRAGHASMCFHDLRHGYATAALQNGDDIKTIQTNLGHATAAFTLDIYSDVTERMKLKSAENMERFIQSVTKGKTQN